MAASAVEKSSLVRLEVTDPRGGGETAAVRQSVLMSLAPLGVLPVLGPRHSTAPATKETSLGVCTFKILFRGFL